MRTIFTVFVFFSLIAALNGQETNVYNSVVERNAFNLAKEKAIRILPPITNIISTDMYLTGITRLNKVQKVHLLIKRHGASNKYISLLEKQLKNGIKLEKIGPNTVYVSDNGRYRLLSLKSNSLPTTLVASGRGRSTPKLMPRSEKKDNDKRDEKKVKKYAPRESVIKVPSRKSKADLKI